MASLLVVDDDLAVRQTLQILLKRHGYTTETAASAEEAQAKLKETEFDLVISDVNMPPGRSGLELVTDISMAHPNVATIMLTGMDDPEFAQTALEMGAYGYIIKPFTNNEILINITSALMRRNLMIQNKSYQEGLESTVLERTRELMTTIAQMEQTEQRLRISQEETVTRLSKAAEFRDNETAMHIQRMSRYSEVLARVAGLDDDRCKLIRIASPMHDIGKIGIQDAVLLKPGKLTPEEYEHIKTHSQIGYHILEGADSEILSMGATIALTHHEKWDGSGYPHGLVGENIPLEGRIVAVADVFDALTSARVYKPAMPVEKALQIMKDGRGTHFDPSLLDLFVQHMDQIESIRSRYPDSFAEETESA